jgi:hypothetical protein
MRRDRYGNVIVFEVVKVLLGAVLALSALSACSAPPETPTVTKTFEQFCAEWRSAFYEVHMVPPTKARAETCTVYVKNGEEEPTMEFRP